MGEEKIKIIESIWFSVIANHDVIGIVKIDTGFGLKWYIGTAQGSDQDYDEQYIAKFGTPIYPENIKEFFNLKQ